MVLLDGTHWRTTRPTAWVPQSWKPLEAGRAAFTFDASAGGATDESVFMEAVTQREHRPATAHVAAGGASGRRCRSIL
jgi:hypothetical protein